MNRRRRTSGAFLRGTVAASLLLLVEAGTAAAHPMGSFSINHYAHITVSPDSVTLRYLVDYAEISALPLLKQLDADGDRRVLPGEEEAFLDSLIPALRENLRLAVNGVPLRLVERFRNASVFEGQGGMNTLAVGIDWSAPLGDSVHTRLFRGDYTDGNYPDRFGWKEIRIDAEGTALLRCDIDPLDPTEGLTLYPEEYISDPPAELEAHFFFGEGKPPPPPAALAGRKGMEDRFAALIRREGSPRFLLGALLVALFLGAVHALEPGHGKTLVAAYLVGSRGTIGQAALLGLVVTATHTLSVFALGLAVLYASRSFVPERIFPWLSLFSGLVVTVIGIALLRGAIRLFRAGNGHADPHHDHHHPHHHHTGHSHVGNGPDGKADAVSLRSLLALGVTGGIVPCPSALVVLLSAVALGRIGFGLALIVAFSAGLALVLMTIGILFVVAGPLLEHLTPGGKTFRYLRLASAVAVTAIGSAILLRALPF